MLKYLNITVEQVEMIREVYKEVLSRKREENPGRCWTLQKLLSSSPRNPDKIFGFPLVNDQLRNKRLRGDVVEFLSEILYRDARLRFLTIKENYK